MLRETVDMAESAMPSRDFDTIRNAVSKGMNNGYFAVTEEYQVATWEWRLLGDFIEVRKRGSDVWKRASQRDINHAFSRGVFGRYVEHIIDFSWYSSR